MKRKAKSEERRAKSEWTISRVLALPAAIGVILYNQQGAAATGDGED
jgi:hypothetical protein